VLGFIKEVFEHLKLIICLAIHLKK